ncbi:MAG: lipid-A-disaccharide synthase [Cyanobacteria bacterium P01_D01_bin.1]
MPTAFGHTEDIVDVVILSNGPGEVATWVKPVVRSLRQKTSSQKAPSYRISVILSPCPHASGKEPAILSNYPEVDRIQSAPNFFRFLLTGKTADDWDWSPRGIVVFLGGDQLYTVMVARRLGYRTLTYAEWDARWTGMVDRFGVMHSKILDKVPKARQHKFTVVGDLMGDVQAIANRTEITDILGCEPEANIIGFLPGSKPIKLEMGVPMLLAIAQILHTQKPSSRPLQYVVGVAPTLTITDLMTYTDPALNDAMTLFNAPSVTLHKPEAGLPYWQIPDGPKIYLWQRFPALDLFSQCQMCFTTVGANTAQLAALATPMIVLLPTQKLDAMKIAEGWPRLASQLPGLRAIARTIIGPLLLKGLQKSHKYFSWPNITAKREVVPELFGTITPQQAANVALDYLTHPEKLDKVRHALRDLRGPAGAADKMANLILETVEE